MSAMNEKPQIHDGKIRAMDYRTRLANYEREKEEYLRTACQKPMGEFQDKLIELARKWRI